MAVCVIVLITAARIRAQDNSVSRLAPTPSATRPAMPTTSPILPSDLKVIQEDYRIGHNDLLTAKGVPGVAAVIERMKTLVIDDALKPGTEIGPVVDQKQLDKNLEYLTIGRQEGARLQAGGELLKRATHSWESKNPCGVSSPNSKPAASKGKFRKLWIKGLGIAKIAPPRFHNERSCFSSEPGRS